MIRLNFSAKIIGASCLSALMSSAFSASRVACVSNDLQSSVLRLASSASDAVIPIMAWTDFRDSTVPKNAAVIGTGFLIDEKGDFVTARHVAATKELTMGQRKIPVTLKATIRQKSGDGSGQPFSVIEEDDEHDIALCRIEGFKVYTPDKSPSVQAFRKSKDPNRTDTTHPFASLGISDSFPDVGRFVVVSGFPLGSWTPTIQPGMVSATQTIYPSGPVAGVPKGTRDLL